MVALFSRCSSSASERQKTAMDTTTPHAWVRHPRASFACLQKHCALAVCNNIAGEDRVCVGVWLALHMDHSRACTAHAPPRITAPHSTSRRCCCPIAISQRRSLFSQRGMIQALPAWRLFDSAMLLEWQREWIFFGGWYAEVIIVRIYLSEHVSRLRLK